MHSAVISLILFILTLTTQVYCHKDGAPSRACLSMTPQHDVEAQISKSPYNISTSKSSGKVGDVISVTINGELPFKGFFLQARKEDSQKILTGEFLTSSNAVQTLNCQRGLNNAVTHTEPNDKTSISVRWTVPSELSGQSLIFQATVVKNYKTFWENVVSSPLTIQ